MHMISCSVWLPTCCDLHHPITQSIGKVMKREPHVCGVASQVGFRDYKAVLKAKVEERVNAIVNRLNGTKRDVPHPDLAGEREAYEKEVGGRYSRPHSCVSSPDVARAILG